MNCLKCGKAMRGSRERLADRPGTVGFGSHGLCAHCYRTSKSPRKEAQAIANTPANRESLAAYLAWRRPYRLKAGNP